MQRSSEYYEIPNLGGLNRNKLRLGGCMPRTPKHQAPPTPEGLALIASWLEDPSHLDRPPVEEFLSDHQTLQSLRSVATFLAREKVAKSSNSEVSASNDASLPEDLTTASSTSPEGFSTHKRSQGVKPARTHLTSTWLAVSATGH